MKKIIIIFLALIIFGTIAKSQTQADSSDSYWEVVRPSPASIDIDFKTCLIKANKDSLVQNFVVNSGSWRFRVDSIYFRGADAAAFSLVSGLPKYFLNQKEGKNTEFRFKPMEARKYQAEIVIITQNDTLIQQIIGEGAADELAVNSNWLDFGKVPLKYSKTISDTILLTNISQKEIKIDSIGNIGPDATQFIILDDTKAFTLQSNGSKKLNIKFEPKEVGRTSGQVAFYYNHLSSPSIVNLFGEGIDIKPKLSTNNPVCVGESVKLYADSIKGAKFFWTGPNNFKSTEQNPIIDDANSSHIGTYSASVLYDIYSSDTASVDVMVSEFNVSPGDSSLIFLGSAERRGISIQLTYPRIFDAGSIWLKNNFSVQNDFSTSFQFITGNGNNNGIDEGSIPGADGFALVFQNNNYPMEGSRGGSIGYTGIPKSLVVEIDLFKNDWDENGNHIAVQSLKTEGNLPYHDNSNACLGISKNIIEIKHGKYYFCKVDYILKEKELKIYIDSTGKFDEVAMIVPNIDFSEYLQLNEKDIVFIGITSATGNAYQNHSILNWRFPCKNIILSQDEGTRIIPLKNELMIYPNPASNNLNIIYSLNKQTNVQFKIINNLGIEIISEQIIRNQEIGQYNYQINIDKLPLGIYHIVLKTDTEQLKQTFVKID